MTATLVFAAAIVGFTTFSIRAACLTIGAAYGAGGAAVGAGSLITPAMTGRPSWGPRRAPGRRRQATGSPCQAQGGKYGATQSSPYLLERFSSRDRAGNNSRHIVKKRAHLIPPFAHPPRPKL